MRVIVDANVAIAAAASRGLCDAVLELCLKHHRPVLCEGILKEIEDKLTSKMRVHPSVVAEFVAVLRQNSEIYESEDVPKGTCRDSGDLMVLGLVGPGKVEAIVTGDKDLLVLKEYRGARIMTPRAFWEMNRKEI
jgi:putative PIN family toxin of toxin-antitoxin system